MAVPPPARVVARGSFFGIIIVRRVQSRRFFFFGGGPPPRGHEEVVFVYSSYYGIVVGRGGPQRVSVVVRAGYFERSAGRAPPRHTASCLRWFITAQPALGAQGVHDSISQLHKNIGVLQIAVHAERVAGVGGAHGVIAAAIHAKLVAVEGIHSGVAHCG